MKNTPLRVIFVLVLHALWLAPSQAADPGTPKFKEELSKQEMIYQSRGDIMAPPFGCKANDSGFMLSLPKSWLDEHPLTEAALEAEAEEWLELDIRFEVRAVGEERALALG